MTEICVNALRSARQRGQLRRVIGPFGFFALCFGSIVGSGWIAVLGEWLQAAGPGGAIGGFAAGAIIMAIIAASYAELASRMPRAGAEVQYTLQTFGPAPAFFVGWFLTLYLTALTGFEASVLPWLLETLFPALRGPELYVIFGKPVTLDAVLIGCAGAALFAAVNYCGMRSTVLFQSIVTYGFSGFAIVLIVLGLSLGRASNAIPLFESSGSHSGVLGALWTYATCAMFLNGFQAAAYAIEERAPGTSSSTIARSMVLGILASATFYCGIILATAFAVPWRTLLHSDLPAARAFAGLTSGGVLGPTVIVMAIISLMKVWNGVAMMATRLVYAQAQLNYFPKALRAVHPRFGSPTGAICFVLAANICGVFFGRGAIVPIINMCSICLAMSFVFCLVILLRQRKRHGPSSGYAVPGGRPVIYVGIAGAAVMTCVALWEPVTRTRQLIPPEWTMIAVWAVIGGLLWQIKRVFPSGGTNNE